MGAQRSDAFAVAHRARRRFTTEAMLALRDKGLNVIAAAAVLGVTDDAIHQRCAVEGHAWPAPRGSALARLPDADFARLWACTRISTDEMAAALGVTRQAVSWRARTMGLPSRAANRRRKADPALLAEMWLAGVSSAEIARHFGMAHHACATTAARLAGLPARIRSSGGTGGRGGWPRTITLDDFWQLRAADRMRLAATAERAATAKRDGLRTRRAA